MRNADMPAMPCQVSIDRDNDAPRPYQFGNDDFVSPGLTKREYFAGLAMQGILANKQYDPPRRQRLDGMADDAVAAADALLAKLEKEAQS